MDNKILQNNIKYLIGSSSQEEFAKKCNLKQITLSRWLNDEASVVVRKPHWRNVKKIADAFGMDVETLYNVDLAKVNDSNFNFGTRKPSSDRYEYTRFKGGKYYVYFLSARGSLKQIVYCGVIQFDKEFAPSNQFLIGNAELEANNMSERLYDCKLVIEDHHTFHIYGIGKVLERRFYICMYYPDYDETRKIEYQAGLGVLVRINRDKSIVAEKVGISKYQLRLDDNVIADKLKSFLQINGAISKDISSPIIVTRKLDGDFREWIEDINKVR